jgi:hypothetical protein
VTPKKAPVRNGRERILDAAEQLFAQRGFDPLVERFIAVTREALPRCPPQESVT